MSYRDEVAEIQRRYREMGENELADAACAAVGIDLEPSCPYDPLSNNRLCLAAQALGWIIDIDRRQFGCIVRVATPPHTNAPFIASIAFDSDGPSPFRAIAEAIAEAGTSPPEKS